MSRDDERRALAEMVSAQGKALAEGLTWLADTPVPSLRGGAPRDWVWQDGPRRVFRYRTSAKPQRPPLLLVYAMVNRPRILDLTPERSLIRALLARGEQVYLLDWGDPRSDDWASDFGDHAITALGQAIDAVCQDANQTQLFLLGVCQGGVMSLCHTLARPERVAGLITTVTPVDFSTPADRFSKLARQVDPALVESCGPVVPGSLIKQMFVALKPLALGHRKYVDVARHLGEGETWRDFAAMEDWIADSPDQPSRTLGEFLRRFYRDNQLMRGGLELAGLSLDPRDLRVPVLNIFAEHDHIVPPEAARALGTLMPATRYSELSVAGGHIGLYVGRAALARVPDAVHAFCADRC